jgi:hypothetical protein
VQEKWTALRTAMSDAYTTSKQPLEIAAENAIREAGPATSPIFKNILAHQPGEQPVPGTLEAGVPRDWAEYEARQEANPDSDDLPPALDEGGGVTFAHLQRWRTYINHRLYGSTELEPGLAHAYRTMLNGIDTAMDDIAKQTGQTKNLAEARAMHEHYQETFSDSPNVKRTAATEHLAKTNPEAAREQHYRDIEQRVAHYDPSYAKDAAEARHAREVLKSFPTEAGLKESLKPPPDVPSFGPEESRAAKRGGLEEQNRWLRHRGRQVGSWVATGGLLYGVLDKNFGSLTKDIIGAGAAFTQVGKLADWLESPKVAEYLTRPDPMTLKQWQRLKPEEQAIVSDALRPIVDAARKKGIMVAPTFVAMVGQTGANQPKTAGEAKQQVARQRGGVNPKVEDEQIVAPDVARGVQGVTLPVVR